MRSEDILTDLEEQYGVKVDSGFDLDLLCDGEFCRHAECDCWDNFRREVESHLDDQASKQKLRGSMSIAELRDALYNADDQDAPVFVNGQPINEAWWDGDGYQITTK